MAATRGLSSSSGSSFRPRSKPDACAAARDLQLASSAPTDRPKSASKPRAALWSPKSRLHEETRTKTNSAASDWSVWLLAAESAESHQRGGTVTGRMRRLVHAAVEKASIKGRLADLDHGKAHEFAESCVISLALWRRFGSAEFAETIGWLERTDYAAMSALLPGRAVEAAVEVWKSGRQAAFGDTAALRSVRQHEIRAWGLGCSPAMARELHEAEQACLLMRGQADEDRLVMLRAARASSAGEAVVRAAYERLLLAPHHTFWDLWRKREAVVQAALTGEALGPVREALRQ
ncbi:unnamed protein product, partial [Polarella glacialis]